MQTILLMSDEASREKAHGFDQNSQSLFRKLHLFFFYKFSSTAMKYVFESEKTGTIVVNSDWL